MRGFFLTIVILFLFVFIFLAGIGTALLFSGDSFSTGDKVAVLRVHDVILDSQILVKRITLKKISSRNMIPVLSKRKGSRTISPKRLTSRSRNLLCRQFSLLVS